MASVQRAPPRFRVGNSLHASPVWAPWQSRKSLFPTRCKTCILFGVSACRAMMVRMKLFEFTMANAKIPVRPVHLFCAIFITFVVASVGCSEKLPPPIKADIPLNSAPATTPSTTVSGVAPAGPTREAAATTSTDKTDVSKEQQSSAMPLPGQANDHSVLLPASSPQRPASR